MSKYPDDLKNKDVRQVAHEWVDEWGATYEGDTSDGHHIFRFPNGVETSISHTPSAGWAWVKARRHEAYKITGIPYKGKRNAQAVKDRRAAERETEATARQAAIQRAVRENLARQAEARQRKATATRWRELKEIERLMGGGRHLTRSHSPGFY